MKRNLRLTVVSLLSLLLLTVPITRDVIRQAEGAVACDAEGEDRRA